MKKKVLIFDGIPSISVGRDIKETLEKQDIELSYLNPKMSCYKNSCYKAQKILNRVFFKRPIYTLKRSSAAKIENFFIAAKPDFVIIIGHSFYNIEKKLLEKLKEKIGFKLYLLDTDSGSFIGDLNELLYFFNHDVATANKIFSISKSMVSFMHHINHQHAELFYYGSNIAIKETPLEQQYDVIFVGVPDAHRILHLENLSGYNIKIFGGAWKRRLHLISADLKSKLVLQDCSGDAIHKEIQKAKIVLNIHRDPWAALQSGLNLRIPETLAIGRFLLTEYSDEIPEMFAIGKELEVFHSIEEMKDKVDYYLKHDAEREKIARAGHEKFLKELTWEKRLRSAAPEFFE